MSDTFASKYIGAVYAGEAGKETQREVVRVGEAGIYPGYCVRVSGDYMYLNKNSDKVKGGICNCMLAHDLDTAYTITTDYANWFACGDNVDVWAFWLAQSPATTLVPGDVLVVGATDGFLDKFAYADGTDITDSATLIGPYTCTQNVTGSTTANKLVRVHI